MTFIFDFIIYKDYSLTYVIFSTAAALLIGVFVLVKHKENIKRLLKGEEKKITAKNDGSIDRKVIWLYNNFGMIFVIF